MLCFHKMYLLLFMVNFLFFSYGQLAVNPRHSVCDTPSLSMALSRLSLSSTRLLQNLEVPTLKSVTRTVRSSPTLTLLSE